MSGAGAAVDVRGLVHEFRGGVRGVDGLDLVVAPGEVVALLGHNGAGKTTTLRHLTGVLAPTAGTVRVLGRDPVADGVAVRRRLGVLLAAPAVDDHLTGRANLRFTARLWGLPARRAERRVAELLELFGLAGRADERAGRYSTGMRQRLALARALVPDPDVLLLDEPTAALDPVAAAQVRDLVGRLAGEERRTVLLSTHNLEEAQRLCDRVVILERGRVAVAGTPDELVRRADAGVVLVETDPAAVDQALAALPGPLRARAAVERGGAVLRLPGTARADVPGLVAALARAGVPVYAVAPQHPTLEDVYLALHRAGVVHAEGAA